MGIEAHSADQENPYATAQLSFESLVSELSSPAAHVMSHSELEGLLHNRGMELLRQLLQAHLDQRGPGESLEPVRSPQGAVLTHQRWGRRRAWESLFGSVLVDRVGYGAKEESMAYPLDGDLNLPRERYSLGVRKRVAQEAVRGSFDEAVHAVVTTTGAHVPKRQAEQLVVRAATDFDAFYKEAEVVHEGATGPILVLSVDGKRVVMRQEHLRDAPGRRGATEQARQQADARREARLEADGDGCGGVHHRAVLAHSRTGRRPDHGEASLGIPQAPSPGEQACVGEPGEGA